MADSLAWLRDYSVSKSLLLVLAEMYMPHCAQMTVSARSRMIYLCQAAVLKSAVIAIVRYHRDASVRPSGRSGWW